MKKSASQRAQRAENVRARARFAKFAEAGRADARGRDVPPTVAGYEAAAAISRRRVAEALIARHNLRMFQVDLVPEWLRMEILSSVIPVIQLGRAARDLGANPLRHPSVMGGTWVDQLMWGIDSLVAASRLLLVGQVAGAAVIARDQIEMWTESRAAIAGISKMADESTADFIARAWSQSVDPKKVRRGSYLSTVFDSPEQYANSSDPLVEHKHILVAGGAEACPAVMWMMLSEMLHGREFATASAWDGACLTSEPPEDALEGIHLVIGALQLSVVHIRMLLLVSSVDLGAESIAQLLKAEMDDFSVADTAASEEGAKTRSVPMPDDYVIPPLSYLAPLLPNEGLSKGAVASLAIAAEAFEGVMNGQRPAGRLYRDDELATAAFGWHRYRSAASAQSALDSEVEVFGADHDMSGLARRANVWVFVGEATALLGGWLPEGGSRDAAFLTASALRSSWWLWLEDDDRAMASLRTVLEQIARLRVWRIKPDRAQLLENRSTPRDWIENSGWKRLGPLNGALGEFAHHNARSNWTEARETLTKIQGDPDPDSAPFTARRAAAELVTQLVATEVREQLRVYSPSVADAVGNLFDDVGATPGDEEKYLDERFNYIWEFRKSTAHKARPLHAERTLAMRGDGLHDLVEPVGP